jgi:hypothetical protein
MDTNTRQDYITKLEKAYTGQQITTQKYSTAIGDNWYVRRSHIPGREGIILAMALTEETALETALNAIPKPAPAVVVESPAAYEKMKTEAASTFGGSAPTGNTDNDSKA